MTTNDIGLSLANFYQYQMDTALQLWLESYELGDCDVMPWISYALTAYQPRC